MPHLHTGTATTEPDTRTQAQLILARLKRGERLTPLDAQEDPDIRCMRLGARIYDLKREGHDIQSRMVKTPSGKHVAEYWMPFEQAAQPELF